MSASNYQRALKALDRCDPFIEIRVQCGRCDTFDAVMEQCLKKATALKMFLADGWRIEDGAWLCCDCCAATKEQS